MTRQAPYTLRTLQIGFGALVLLQAILLAASVLSFREVEKANGWSVHTYKVLVETGGIGESLVNIDTGARGFAITGEERFLQPLHEGRAAFSLHFHRAQSLTAEDPAQQARLLRLQDQYVRWNTVYVATLLTARRATERQVMPNEIASIADKGKPYTDTMRSGLADINATESRLLEERTLRVERLRLWTQVMLLGGDTFALLLAVLLSGLLVNNTRRLTAANAELEAEIAERLRSEVALRAANEEAEQAREEAERANLSKSEFLSRMSHELRTPLNAILGFGQLLELAELESRQHEAVGHVVTAGRHLLNLINEVLDIARIEAGGMELSPEPIEAGEIVRETLDLVRPLATTRRIEIAQDLGEVQLESAFVCADRQRLRQVLLNLLSNAIKYNRDGGTVCMALQSRGEHQLRILVRDTGPGIAPQQIERLFVPFDRLGAERTMVEGVGLGLTLSKSLIETMGGQIGVDSAVGEGSTFWIELPLVEAPERNVTQAPGGEPTAATERPPRTLLYIEDNLSNLRLVESILEQRTEILLLSAGDGASGLAMARERIPNLILLDLHLPDGHGHDVLLRLRAEPATRHIPVVVLSADATPRQVRRLLAAGADDYLTKPLDVREFLQAVEKWMRAEEER